jgi:hypothetical protein
MTAPADDDQDGVLTAILQYLNRFQSRRLLAIGSGTEAYGSDAQKSQWCSWR